MATRVTIARITAICSANALRPEDPGPRGGATSAGSPERGSADASMTARYDAARRQSLRGRVDFNVPLTRGLGLEAHVLREPLLNSRVSRRQAHLALDHQVT